MEFEKAKQILNEQKEIEYTDEEIMQMLDFLDVLAILSINNLLKRN
ncbi:hypothetical protein [Flavobacterium sp.]|nr:hypothetical protein [Flavobacterium sp.]MDI1316442.1 hypothetical protein [Flavobacterium sp.]